MYPKEEWKDGILSERDREWGKIEGLRGKRKRERDGRQREEREMEGREKREKRIRDDKLFIWPFMQMMHDDSIPVATLLLSFFVLLVLSFLSLFSSKICRE